KLDPHTTYIPATQLSDVNADIQGSFSGIGVEYQIIQDTMTVVYVLEKGSSEEAGLQAGDQLVSVEGQVIAGKGLGGNELRKLLRGANRSKVNVGVLRQGKPFTFTITRGNVPLPSLDAAYMAAPQTGYIRLNKFSETTYREFMDAATRLEKEGMKKLIMDLRGNGGGLLEAATYIADELLEDGLLIVSTKGANVRNRETRSTKPGIFEKGELVVLIDEFSASASEVLAGAIQDNDRGTIVGRRSFGKGLVQEQFTLSNGAAIRLTVARYFTPTGRSIQKPFNGNRADYRHEILDRMQPNDSTRPATDSSHIKVFTTRAGKKVYEGGGITPDVVVAPDSITTPRGAWGLYNQNLLAAYSFKLYRQEQPVIRKFAQASQYAEQYKMPANAFSGLVNQAKADSIAVEGNLAAAIQPLETRLKALMARYVWRNDGYYQVLNRQDPVVLKSLEILSTKPGKN
ncbi:MAG TPA: S41 family peptidase, partial [Phnomibacter sp.]|nr:S41 family peptidase [Phnomibacter sp.]